MSESPSSNSARKFRTNPIELAIFAVITLVFMNSVYTLFYEQNGFKPAALSPMVANPLSEINPVTPSASGAAVANIEVGCDASLERDSAAAKVRLSGLLCANTARGASDDEDGGSRSPASADAPKVVKAVITNGANRFNATVFLDAATGKFSTDYIPLNTGKNPIHVDYFLANGKTRGQDIVIMRQ